MIKRDVLHDLREHLTKKEITLITGPRQAGKTTLMKLLQGEIDKRGEKTLMRKRPLYYKKLRRISVMHGKK